MFDRVLLLLLVILLPLGIVASRMFTGELTIGGKTSTVDEQKVAEIVQRLAPQQSTPSQSTATGAFNVTGMVYATESGKLQVVGMAPNNQTLMWVWTASTRTKQTKKVASPSAIPESNPMWDGPLVLEPKVGGFFSVYIDVSLMAGVVEIRLEQGTAVSVVRYDLDKRVQLPK